MRLITILAFMTVHGVAAAPVALADAGSLRIDIQALSSRDGHVLIALYDNAKAYDKDGEPLRKDKLAIDDELQARWVIDDLEPGEYGVGLFHDLDDDGELDSNFVGMPTEPYGFSNNARAPFGPPAYDKITFTFDGQDMTLTILPE